MYLILSMVSLLLRSLILMHKAIGPPSMVSLME